jgi:hypothetical protein
VRYAEDAACVLVEIGSAGAEMIRTLLPLVLRIHFHASQAEHEGLWKVLEEDGFRAPAGVKERPYFPLE